MWSRPRSQATIGWRPAARMTATNIRTMTAAAAQANAIRPTTSAAPIVTPAPRAIHGASPVMVALRLGGGSRVAAAAPAAAPTAPTATGRLVVARGLLLRRRRGRLRLRLGLVAGSDHRAAPGRLAPE